MHTHAVRILGVTLTLIRTGYAQTYTACDPTNGKKILSLEDKSIDIFQ